MDIINYNGLTVAFSQQKSERHRIELVVKAGMFQETPQQHGYAHLLEHLESFFPSEDFPDSAENQEMLTSIGVQVNAWTEHNSCGYWMEGLVNTLPLCIKMMMATYTNPKWDPKIFEQEKTAVIQELTAMLEEPWTPLEELMLKTQYPSTSVALGIEEEIKNVKKATKNEVMKYRKKWYHPKNTVIIITADRDLIDFNIETYFENIFSKKRSIPKPLKETILEYDHYWVKTNTNSYRLMFGFHIPFTKWDRKALVIDYIRDILTGGLGSRLMKELRTNMGAIYSIKSLVEWDHRNPNRNFFFIRVDVNPEHISAVYDRILDEIGFIVGFYGTESEIKYECERRLINDHQAQDNIMNSYHFRRHTKDIEEQIIWNGPIEDLSTQLEKRKSITYDEIIQIAQLILGNGFILWYAGPKPLLKQGNVRKHN